MKQSDTHFTEIHFLPGWLMCSFPNTSTLCTFPEIIRRKPNLAAEPFYYGGGMSQAFWGIVHLGIWWKWIRVKWVKMTSWSAFMMDKKVHSPQKIWLGHWSKVIQSNARVDVKFCDKKTFFPLLFRFYRNIFPVWLRVWGRNFYYGTKIGAHKS